MKKYIIIVIILINCITLNAQNNSVSFNVGIYDELGFFSNYLGVDAGIDFPVFKIKLGLHQKIGYGFTYKEVLGITGLRFFVHEQGYFEIGGTYLIKEANISKDFNATVMPVMGFGFYLYGKNKNIIFIPTVFMNQSFYLSDSIRPIYTDLPFPIAMTLGLGIAYRR